MVMIKNIILDMGNVLLSYDPQIPLDTYCDSQEEKELIRQVLFGSDIWLEADKGLLKNAELFDRVKQQVAPDHWAALQNCCEHWDICMKPIAGAREFCERAKAGKYGLYVLSNANDKFYDYFERLLPLQFFDGVVVSSDIRMIKPDREAFEYVLKTYGLKAEECLFVDDSACNVDAARAIGMTAHLFRNDYRALDGYLTEK